MGADSAGLYRCLPNSTDSETGLYLGRWRGADLRYRYNVTLEDPCNKTERSRVRALARARAWCRLALRPPWVGHVSYLRKRLVGRAAGLSGATPGRAHAHPTHARAPHNTACTLAQRRPGRHELAHKRRQGTSHGGRTHTHKHTHWRGLAERCQCSVADSQQFCSRTGTALPLCRS